MNNKAEITILENIIRLIRKGEYKINGDEALVIHQSLSYLIEKVKSLTPQPIVAAESKPIQPESPIKKPKKDK
jgi:hypothetical protein